MMIIHIVYELYREVRRKSVSYEEKITDKKDIFDKNGSVTYRQIEITLEILVHFKVISASMKTVKLYEITYK